MEQLVLLSSYSDVGNCSKTTLLKSVCSKDFGGVKMSSTSL